MRLCDLARLKILSDTYAKLSDDDKRVLFQLTQEQHSEVMKILERSDAKIDDLQSRVGNHPFISDLFANVAGNYITEGINWIVKSLIKR